MSSGLGGKSMVIALAVKDTEIGGYIDSSSDLWDTYTTNAPWKNETLADQPAANGDVQAALLAAIAAVQQPPVIPPDMVPWLIFVVVIVLFAIAVPFFLGPRLISEAHGNDRPDR